MSNINVEVEIPLSRIADLLCSAFEGGVGYWARIEKYVEPTNTIDLEKDYGKNWEQIYPYVHYPLYEGGAVIIRDTQDGKKYTLDRAAIERGLSLFFKKNTHHVAAFLTEDDDAGTGDAFVQFCLLGELVYG